jgi:hypothetical protein
VVGSSASRFIDGFRVQIRPEQRDGYRRGINLSATLHVPPCARVYGVVRIGHGCGVTAFSSSMVVNGAWSRFGPQPITVLDSAVGFTLCTPPRMTPFPFLPIQVNPRSSETCGVVFVPQSTVARSTSPPIAIP